MNESLILTGLSLVQRLYHLEITEIRNEEDARAFSKRHLLHPLQMQMSADGILMMKEHARKDGIYLLNDVFLMRTALFYLQDHFLILGPVTTLLLSRHDAVRMLDTLGIRDITPEDLLLYRESYPNLTKAQLRNILLTLPDVLDPDSAQRTVFDTPDSTPFAREDTDLPADRADRPHYVSMLEKRYSYEQHFIEAVKKGSTRSALLNLSNMQQDVTYLKRIGTTLENERVGAAITRTTARLAALNAGVAPLLADRISSENTKRTMQAKTVTQILEAKEQMVRAFCQAVQNSLSGAHSALAQSAVYYLEHKCMNPIRLEDLAKSLDTSEGNLIRTFRSEYGITPIAYLNRFRAKQAADLLLTTTMTVQEISHAVGVEDANYFVKLFRRAYGKTPSAYRKQHQV